MSKKLAGRRLRIGFFGDSFCKSNLSGTYINKLQNYLQADVVNLGTGGSSIEDAILLQFNPMKESPPDICVFLWTSAYRLYHPKIRNITIHSAYQNATHTDNPVWSAAYEYYKHISDIQATNFRYVSVLFYFESKILASLPKNTKIIHLWSFGESAEWSHDAYAPNKLTYAHRFSTGVEIRPSLVSLACFDRHIDKITNDTCPNHLNNQEKNEILFQWILDAIQNYQNGRLIDESTTIQLKRKD